MRGRELRPGDTVGGLVLIERVGSPSGQAHAWKAHDDDGRTLLLKVLQPQHISDPRMRERFRRELEIGQRIDSQLFARIVAFNVDDPELPWIAFSFIEGRELNDVIMFERPSLDRASIIAEQLARALVVLGDAGLVHRDLKPQNIMCGAGDSVYILDLGLAYDPQKPSITTTPWGTPDYMAPEQQLNRNITPATDVWALGLILAELTGRRHPYGGLLPDVRLGAMADPSVEPDLSQVPPGWRSLARECLRHDPAERPTAAQLLESIRRLRTGGARPGGCLDLYSGTGSLAAGVQSAGIRVALTADFDPTSRGLCDQLLGTPTFLETDLHHTQAGDLLEASGLEPGEVILMCGEPPCQGPSLARHHQSSGESGLEAFVRLVSDLTPQLVALVGPAGLSTRLSGSLDRTVSSLRAAGYRLADPQILESSAFGATVACRRLLLVGRIDGREPSEMRVPEPGAATLRVRERLAAVERDIALEPYMPRLPEKVRESLAEGAGRDRGRVRLSWDDMTVHIAGARWVVHPDGDRCLNLSELASLYGYVVGPLPGRRTTYEKVLRSMLPQELASAIGGHLRDELAR